MFATEGFLEMFRLIKTIQDEQLYKFARSETKTQLILISNKRFFNVSLHKNYSTENVVQ